jgi:hypothetical protein
MQRIAYGSKLSAQEAHMCSQKPDSKVFFSSPPDRLGTQMPVRQPAYKNNASGDDELRNAPERQSQSGVLSLIAEKVLAWQERRFVAQASKELLALYQSISAIYPDWTRRKIYQLVVMRRTGCDSAAANLILDAAQESYARWPSSRELNLCDVAHYLSVTEFLASHPGMRGMHSSLTPVVASQVPSELCAERATT